MKDATSGTFSVRLTNGTTGLYSDITITPVYTTNTNPVIDPGQTEQAILTALQGATAELGINWFNYNTGTYWTGQYGTGPVSIRLLSDQEVITREGSVCWDRRPIGTCRTTLPLTRAGTRWSTSTKSRSWASASTRRCRSGRRPDSGTSCRSASAVRRCRAQSGVYRGDQWDGGHAAE